MSEAVEKQAAFERARWQFSLRAVFLLTLAAAALAAIGRVAPQLDVLAVGLAVAVWSTLAAMRAWRRTRRISAAAWAVLSLSWCMFYMVSVGPAAVIALRFEWTFPFLVRVYAPLDWLCDHTPLNDALHWYVQFWLQLM